MHSHNLQNSTYAYLHETKEKKNFESEKNWLIKSLCDYPMEHCFVLSKEALETTLKSVLRIKT